MIGNSIGGPKPMVGLVGILALCGIWPAGAGVLSTTDLLGELVIAADATVDYYPDLRELSNRSRPNPT